MWFIIRFTVLPDLQNPVYCLMRMQFILAMSYQGSCIFMGWPACPNLAHYMLFIQWCSSSCGLTLLVVGGLVYIFFFAGSTCIYLAISLLTNGACFGKSNLLEAYINSKKAKKWPFSSVLFPWNHNALCGKHIWFSDGCGYGCVGATVMHFCTLKYSSHFRFINVYMDMDTGCTWYVRDV